jgi:hypothetical protein
MTDILTRHAPDQVLTVCNAYNSQEKLHSFESIASLCLEKHEKQTHATEGHKYEKS